MQPNFGCDLGKVVMEPLTDLLLGNIEATIESAIVTWLPYITIQDLRTYRVDGKPNTLGISLSFSLQNNSIETESIELQITP
jgi:phage baseplate assembly protein W